MIEEKIIAACGNDCAACPRYTAYPYEKTEEELNHIWDSLFNHESSKPLPSQAHYAGRLYLSVFLAKLKHQFPEEFNAITNN